MTTFQKRLPFIFLGVGIILLIPLIGNKLTTGEGWSAFDFVVAASLILTVGIGCNYMWSRFNNIEHRLAMCGLVLIVILTIWAELAVGVFSSPIAGN